MPGGNNKRRGAFTLKDRKQFVFTQSDKKRLDADPNTFQNHGYEAKCVESGKRWLVVYPKEMSFVCAVCMDGPYTMQNMYHHHARHLANVDKSLVLEDNVSFRT